jgi:hypothetical protein
MNRLVPLAFLIAALLPAAVLAQNAPAAGTAAAPQAGMQYNDPAMSFTAPAGFKPMPVPSHDPATFEDPAVVAAFVKNIGTRDAMSIVLRMQNFDGTADAWATTADNDLRGSTDGAFIKRNQATLSNGMPAYWEVVTVGSGFDQIKTYQYLWSDGVRGVTLSLICRDGVIGDDQAKALLSNVTAVAYPKYRY